MKVAIIGAGQQGTSIAQGLNSQSAYDLSIYDSSQNILERFGQQPGIQNVKISPTGQDAVKEADINVLAIPIDQFASVIQSYQFKPGSIIVDIGSCKKASIEKIIAVLPPDVEFISVHPVNGKAMPGPESGDAKMYENQPVIIIKGGDPAAEETVCGFWKDMGARIFHMDADTHDTLYGTISHLEHVVAFALTGMGENKHAPGRASEDYLHLGKTGLATTRISAGSPDMWIPVFHDNRKKILDSARGFYEQLDILETALESSSPALLRSLIDSAHAYRKNFKDEKRESIAGEVEDCNFITSGFNQDAQIKLARRITLPAIIGAAITLNAMETDKKLDGISISQLANPSFRDGSAPMLSDPGYVTSLFRANKQALKQELKNFRHEMDQLIGSIENGDAEEIRVYMKRVNSIRADMPPKANPSTARPEYEII